MYKPSILIKTDNTKNLIDMVKVSSLTTRSIPKELEILDKNLHSQDLKKLSLHSLKSTINNINIMNSKSNNLTEIHLLKYKPKRLIKLKEQGKSLIPFYKMCGISLDYDKTFNSEEKLKKKQNTSQNLLNNLSEKELMNYNNDTEFKSNYIFKFSKNTEIFNKLSNNIDLIDNNTDKRLAKDTFEKLFKLIENQNKLYFNLIDNSVNNNNNISVINNFDFSPVKTNFTNVNSKNQNNNMFPNIFTSTSNNIDSMKNLNKSISSSNTTTVPNFNIINMKKVVIFWSDFISAVNKLLSLIFNNFSICKKENEKLKKKTYSDDLKLNNKINELEDLKKYINRLDISMKINHHIQKEKEIKELKQEFKKRENEYMVLIYKLEEEIRDLTVLLDKTKNYYDNYKSISKEIDKNKRQCERLKMRFNKELQDSNVKVLIEKDTQDELKTKINELNQIINEMKLEKEANKKVTIEFQAKIKKLEMIIGEKEENILMINEELEWFMRKLSEEKFNFNNIKTEFNLLERKIVDLEEANKHNKENNKIIGINPLSPNQIKTEESLGPPSPTDFTQGNNI